MGQTTLWRTLLQQSLRPWKDETAVDPQSTINQVCPIIAVADRRGPNRIFERHNWMSFPACFCLHRCWRVHGSVSPSTCRPCSWLCDRNRVDDQSNHSVSHFVLRVDFVPAALSSTTFSALTARTRRHRTVSPLKEVSLTYRLNCSPIQSEVSFP